MSTFEPLLTPGEVAAMFGVGVKQVARWAKAGKITTFRTLGNHRRFQESEVRALLDASHTPRVVPADDPAMYAALGLDGAEEL